jgi:hypothetical protein
VRAALPRKKRKKGDEATEKKEARDILNAFD